ncbi:MAG: hypothetical protein CM15mP120_06060 [Pseudomonadota bacterium]|nr:MAG: hypothetical protein CM15mP120_06060 [Pseudomonadota bacterium]
MPDATNMGARVAGGGETPLGFRQGPFGIIRDLVLAVKLTPPVNPAGEDLMGVGSRVSEAKPASCLGSRFKISRRSVDSGWYREPRRWAMGPGPLPKTQRTRWNFWDFFFPQQGQIFKGGAQKSKDRSDCGAPPGAMEGVSLASRDRNQPTGGEPKTLRLRGDPGPVGDVVAVCRKCLH